MFKVKHNIYRFLQQKIEYWKFNQNVIAVLYKLNGVVRASFSSISGCIGINIDLGPRPWLLASSMLAFVFLFGCNHSCSQKQINKLQWKS